MGQAICLFDPPNSTPDSNSAGADPDGRTRNCDSLTHPRRCRTCLGESCGAGRGRQPVAKEQLDTDTRYGDSQKRLATTSCSRVRPRRRAAVPGGRGRRLAAHHAGRRQVRHGRSSSVCIRL
jgi:hypothetical protein